MPVSSSSALAAWPGARVALAARLAKPRPGLGGAAGAGVAGVDLVAHQIEQLDREERWPQQRCLGDAIVAIRDRSESEHEQPVQRVAGEQHTAGHGVWQVAQVEGIAQVAQVRRHQREHGDVAPPDRAWTAIIGVADRDPAPVVEPGEIGG